MPGQTEMSRGRLARRLGIFYAIIAVIGVAVVIFVVNKGSDEKAQPAIAGGYTPRARKSAFKLTRNAEMGAITSVVPPTVQLLPGDTLVIGERWF